MAQKSDTIEDEFAGVRRYAGTLFEQVSPVSSPRTYVPSPHTPEEIQVRTAQEF